MLRQNILFIKRFCANVCLTKSLICIVCRPAVVPFGRLFLTETWGQWGAPSAADGLLRPALRARCRFWALLRVAAGGFRLVAVVWWLRKMFTVSALRYSSRGWEHFSGSLGALLRSSWRGSPGQL